MYYIKRIFNNKLKLIISLLFIVYPFVDCIMILLDIKRGASVPSPYTATFLTSCVYNVCQILLLWYLPLYLLIIVADDCIEDYKTGYKSILISKFGRKAYIARNILKGFLFGFVIMLVSLIINFVTTQIIFSGGHYIAYDINTINSIPNLKSSFEHPILTNFIYIVITSIITGIVGAGAVAISIGLRNRLIVYPAVFIMWYIPTSTFERPILLALQPFTEFSVSDAFPSLLFVLFINASAIVFACIKELKYETV